MRNRNQAGFGILLELLVAMAISTILLAGSMAIVYRVRAVQNQVDAQMRLRQIAQAEAAILICAQTVGCTPSPGLRAIIPPDGSVIQQSGYNFSFNWNGGSWTYTAIPISQSFSGVQTFYVDYTGTLRCMPNNSPSAGPASPAC